MPFNPNESDAEDEIDNNIDDSPTFKEQPLKEQSGGIDEERPLWFDEIFAQVFSRLEQKWVKSYYLFVVLFDFQHLKWAKVNQTSFHCRVNAHYASEDL